MTEVSKDRVNRYIEEVWNRGNLAIFDGLTTPGFTYRLGSQPPLDRSGMKQFLASTRSAFPDWRVEVVTILAESDLVAVQWAGRATHKGSFQGIPPTQRIIEVSGINLYRLAGELIDLEVEQMDSLGMLRQMGIFGASSPGDQR